MKTTSRKSPNLSAVLVCGLITLVATATAMAAVRPGRAAVMRISGTAEVQNAAGQSWQPLKIGMALDKGATVRTGKGAVVDLALTTRALLRVEGDSQATLDIMAIEARGLPVAGEATPSQTRVTLKQGTILVRKNALAPGSRLEIATTAGVVQAHGGGLQVAVNASGMCVRDVQGAAVAHLPDGQNMTVAEGYLFCCAVPVVKDTPIPIVLTPLGQDSQTLAYRTFLTNTDALAPTVLDADYVVVEKLAALVEPKAAPSTASVNSGPVQFGFPPPPIPVPISPSELP